MRDFDDVVVKPYRINEMLDKIERTVREGPREHSVRGADHLPNGTLDEALSGARVNGGRQEVVG